MIVFGIIWPFLLIAKAEGIGFYEHLPIENYATPDSFPRMPSYAALRHGHAPGHAEECNPKIDSSAAHFLIGYGSLMQRNSKKRTDPEAGNSVPVRVAGYQRKWNTRGYRLHQLTREKYKTTFLGVSPDFRSSLNGVVFRVNRPEAMLAYDQREAFYCRHAVPPSKIKFLNRHAPQPLNSKYWIYVTKPEFDAGTSVEFPIVEAYSDLFLSGCLELEKEFSLGGFGVECVNSTSGWGTDWVNNREVMEIDRLLMEGVPHFGELTLKGLSIPTF